MAVCTRALHEAMIKIRFAETILKAKMLLNGSADPVKIQQEKEEIRRLQARIRVAKADELKKQRHAARSALTLMENSVVIDDNFQSFKELKMLCGSEVMIGGSSLEGLGLGLVLKDDDDDCVDDDYEDLQKRRVAERNALQRMELSVDIEQNLETEKQLQSLCGCTDALRRVVSGYPLKRLGLVLKEEFWGGDDDDDDDDIEDDIEEGEIID